jgi:Uma2 family endonuclease
MIQVQPKHISLDEFLLLPETKPASEYIDGAIIQKPMPQGKHSSLQTELSTIINLRLRPQRIARAFSELRCTFGNRSIVPDISVLTWNRISRDENGEIANVFQLAPDWVIEILSPEQNQTKVAKNILHCLDYETEMGWLIDPEERTVFVHQPNQRMLVFDRPEQPIPVPSFAKELKFTLQDVFSGLLE